jgi:hypothetical protein
LYVASDPIFLVMPALATPAALHSLTQIAPPIEMVREGCGEGWHLASWRDRWGKWHRHCAPNRG